MINGTFPNSYFDDFIHSAKIIASDRVEKVYSSDLTVFKWILTIRSIFSQYLSCLTVTPGGPGRNQITDLVNGEIAANLLPLINQRVHCLN